MSEQGGFAAIIQLLDKFINNYGLWLWLSIFGFLVIFLGSKHFVTLTSGTITSFDLAIIGTLFSFCMLLNAASVHNMVARMATLTYERAVYLMVERHKEIKRIDLINSKFDRIINCDCKERHWIIWFTYVFRPGYDKTYFVKIIQRWREIPSLNISDPIAWSLFYHNILTVSDERAMEVKTKMSPRPQKWEAFTNLGWNNGLYLLDHGKEGDVIQMIPAIDFSDRIYSLSDKDAVLAAKISEIRLSLAKHNFEYGRNRNDEVDLPVRSLEFFIASELQSRGKPPEYSI